MAKHNKPTNENSSAGAQPTRGFVMPEGRFGSPRPTGPQATGALPPRTAPSSPPAFPGTAAMPPVAGRAPVAAGGYVPTYQVNPEPPKKHRGLKIFGIAAASIIGVIALIYFAGVIVFSGRFFPQSTIIGMDISGKTPEEVHQMLDGVLGDYTFKVEGHGLNLTLDATDMGMALDSQSIADGLLSEMNPWAWPYEVFQRHDDTDDLVSTLENSKLADTLTAAVEEANAKGVAPKNATVAFDGDEGAYVVVPEEEGNTLLADVVIDEVTRGTVNFAPKVTLTDAALAKPTVTRDDPSLADARDAANKLLGGALSLTMAGTEKMAITPAQIAEHITLGDDLAVSFDPEPLVAAVKEQVNAMDTTGATRTYTRPDGKTVTVKGGDYGWITDSQATADAVREALNTGAGGTLEIIMKQNAAQAPDENGRDFGTRYIDVDLTEQHARLYGEDGAILWESDIVSGKPSDGRDTPQGTFYIKTNDGKSVLRGYKPDGSKDYETEVDFWMPFKDNSVGFHDAGWQPKFGGDWYVEHGSHGCVNLPPDKAKELHEVLSVGDVVVVHE
ncbi:L,D-transpeptidase family protein [Adlercreutzia shanghongiae]|uniref:L,D-transpeptidase family protein n=1 Tax=Adlercreutzia shanghongiae TaxID=3111773 RepID=A0ABU6J0X6_9ACTN|nr:L,D-transpeptidase family protein [Adlercreutzia sp. R22]MEC4295588.1 L,D-transpeptidase family protein [Adlercreutzia sp. R22]